MRKRIRISKKKSLVKSNDYKVWRIKKNLYLILLDDYYVDENYNKVNTLVLTESIHYCPDKQYKYKIWTLDIPEIIFTKKGKYTIKIGKENISFNISRKNCYIYHLPIFRKQPIKLN